MVSSIPNCDKQRNITSKKKCPISLNNTQKQYGVSLHPRDYCTVGNVERGEYINNLLYFAFACKFLLLQTYAFTPFDFHLQTQ